MVETSLMLNMLQTGAILIGVFIALMEIRHMRQTRETELETRQAQLFMQLYTRFSEEKKGLRVLDALQNSKYESVDEFLELQETDENFRKVIEARATFFEGIGVLVKEGLLNIRYVALMWAGPTKMFWEKIKPVIEDLREHYGYPRLWSEAEYLCKEVIKYTDKHPELKT
jgi:ABC-type multidrug transport system fused ATPase/permease subunit